MQNRVLVLGILVGVVRAQTGKSLELVFNAVASTSVRRHRHRATLHSTTPPTGAVYQLTTGAAPAAQPSIDLMALSALRVGAAVPLVLLHGAKLKGLCR